MNAWQVFHVLRSVQLRRWIIACFAFTGFASSATPFIAPQRMELLCSASSASKLLIKNADGEASISAHEIECALCLPLVYAPPTQKKSIDFRSDLEFSTQVIPAARLAAKTAAPLPARGPPIF